MAYLPFYLTPEEFALKQKQQEQEIAAGRDQIRWHKYDIEEAFRYLYFCYALVPMIPFYILTYVIFDPDEIFLNSMMIGLSILMSGVCYLTFALDYRYDYTLSERGLVVKKRRNMPRWVNSAVQVVAWFGAGFCVFMVATVGPMVLVGAGGLILLSFTRLKRQPDEEAEVRISCREDWLFAQYNRERKVLVLYFKYDSCRYRDVAKTLVVRSHNRGGSHLFFKTNKEMEAVIEKLTRHYRIECVAVEDHRDLFGIECFRPAKLLETPSRTRLYPVAEVMELNQTKAPLPDWKYLYQGKFRTKAEIEQRQSQAMVAEE